MMVYQNLCDIFYQTFLFKYIYYFFLNKIYNKFYYEG